MLGPARENRQFCPDVLALTLAWRALGPPPVRLGRLSGAAGAGARLRPALRPPRLRLRLRDRVRRCAGGGRHRPGGGGARAGGARAGAGGRRARPRLRPGGGALRGDAAPAAAPRPRQRRARPQLQPGGRPRLLRALPLASALFAATAGVLAGLAPARPRRGRLLAFALPVASILWTLLRLYRDPPVFAFDPFGGYFPGRSTTRRCARRCRWCCSGSPTSSGPPRRSCWRWPRSGAAAIRGAGAAGRAPRRSRSLAASIVALRGSAAGWGSTSRTTIWRASSSQTETTSHFVVHYHARHQEPHRAGAADRGPGVPLPAAPRDVRRRAQAADHRVGLPERRGEEGAGRRGGDALRQALDARDVRAGALPVVAPAARDGARLRRERSAIRSSAWRWPGAGARCRTRRWRWASSRGWPRRPPSAIPTATRPFTRRPRR